MKTLLNEDEFQETAQLSHCFLLWRLTAGGNGTLLCPSADHVHFTGLSRYQEHVWLSFLAVEPKDLADLVCEKKKSGKFISTSPSA